MNKRAIQAVFVNYSRVRTRKVMKLEFEVPIEKWPEVYKILGEPDIETSAWFGIAAMNVEEPAPTADDQGANLAANAAIMLSDPMFRGFLSREYNLDIPDVNAADGALKQMLDIDSKSILNRDPQKAAQWRELRAEFEAWKLAA